MTTLTAPPGHTTRADQQGHPQTPTHSGIKGSIPARIPATADDSEDWRKRAVCANDPDADRWVDLPQVVIKGRLNPAYDQRLTELAAVCSGCPVADTCLGEALAMNVRGVFAGTDEFERADLRESLGLPTPPPVPAPETEDDARLMDQQFEALRLARRNLSNKQIAAELGVSTMTVSRLFASEDRPAKRRSRSTP